MQNERASVTSDRSMVKDHKRSVFGRESIAYTAATSNKSFDISTSQIMKGTPKLKIGSNKSRHSKQLSFIDVTNKSQLPLRDLRTHTNVISD